LKFDPFAQLPRFQEALIGSVVALQSHVGLLTEFDTKEAPFADFSYFDCMSCHHELKASPKGVMRPVRRGIAGRPPLPLWPTIQLKSAVEHVADVEGKDFAAEWKTWEAHLAKLELALTARPFGDPAAVVPAAKELHAELGKLAQRLRLTQFDKPAGQVAIKRLATMGTEVHDYYTARHLAWAINGIDKDVSGAPYAPFEDTPPPLFGGVGKDIFQKNGDYLHLKLPSMQKDFIVDDLRNSLPAAAKYDADRFDADLKMILSNFSAKPSPPSAAP
jgi:hypothetical protein